MVYFLYNAWMLDWDFLSYSHCTTLKFPTTPLIFNGVFDPHYTLPHAFYPYILVGLYSRYNTLAYPCWSYS